MNCNCVDCIHRSSCMDWEKAMRRYDNVSESLCDEHMLCEYYEHQSGISVSHIVDALNNAWKANIGDEATEYIILAIGAEILGCTTDDVRMIIYARCVNNES